MSQPTADNRLSKNRFGKHKKTFLLLTMVAPGAIWLLLLRYLPMFGITMAFQDYKIYKYDPTMIGNILHSKFVGFRNFEFIFASTSSLRMIVNTLVYNLVFIGLGLVISVAFAIMLSEVTKKFAARTFQTLMFFPYFMSWIVASYFLLAFLDPTRGLIVHAQINAGVEVTNWYNETQPWPVILVIANLWKNVGYSSILYLAAITGIDQSQYEAARIDGASKWQQVLYITMPHLKTMIVILFIMNVGKIFNADFGLFWNVPMQSPSLIPVTEVIDTFVYRAFANSGNVGMTTAAGLLQNVIGFVCIMTANSIVRKVDPDSSLF